MTLTDIEREFFIKAIRKGPYVFIYDIKANLRKRLLEKFLGSILIEVKKGFIYRIDKQEFLRVLNNLPQLELSEFKK